jgi:hypothetical protein
MGEWDIWKCEIIEDLEDALVFWIGWVNIKKKLLAVMKLQGDNENNWTAA